MVMRLLITFVTAVLLAAALQLYFTRDYLPQQATENPPRELRLRPLAIAPVLDADPYIEQERARGFLSRMVPEWAKLKPWDVVHAVRLWGSAKQWAGDWARNDPAIQAGIGDHFDSWLRYLLSSEQFRRQSQSDRPLLFKTDYGVQVRADSGGEDDRGIVHPDQVLMALGDAGVSADTPVYLNQAETADVRALLADSLKRFTLSQELEFTTVAYCRWLPPTRQWTNRFGEQFTFEDLARELLNRPVGAGSCFGAHVPYALVHLIRADEQFPILSSRTRTRILGRLREISDALERTQLANGAWDCDYYDTASSRGEPEGAGSSIDQFIVTGHHLEWIALAPLPSRPNRATIEFAARFLCNFADHCSAMTIRGTYGPFSHAARAVLMLSQPRHACISNWNLCPDSPRQACSQRRVQG